MVLQELDLTEKQIAALKKKKITSVESLLRKEPLHYYDFSTTYALDIGNVKTREMLKKNRPFAIYGTCVYMETGISDHTKIIKMRIEDDWTKNCVASGKGNYLFVNVMGYDQFRQSFLAEHKESPHRKNIVIPEGIVSYYNGEKKDVKSPCQKQIDFLNHLEEYSAKDFIAIKSGGLDGWSKASVNDLLTEQMESFLGMYVTDHGAMSNILRWYGRGLRLDLAIKKVLIDDEKLLRHLILNQKFLVGGFIQYHDENKSYSVLNPVAFSSDLSKFECYNVQYSQVKGITPERYEEIIKKGCEKISSIDFLPPMVCSQFQIPSFKDSAIMMHFPKSFWQIKKAQERATFEDLLYLAIKLELENQKKTGVPGIKMKDYSLMKKYADSLPYELTRDQKNAVNTLFRHMAAGISVNSLVQGDVGTGKTAVAFCLMLIAVSNGYQAALTAPYTTLASQHYRDMLEIADVLGIETVFLSSEVKGKEKKAELEKISSGEAKIIIGTHSIFSKEVEYKNLALIIQDEEHKFGVVHREELKRKAMEGCHVITMSATPIPKTIAATIYDESVDVISIVEKPANRIPIQTAVCQKDETAMKFMAAQIKEGHQCYVVCPSIDTTEKREKTIASIKEKEKIYRNYFEPLGMSVAVVTGKLKAEEKNRIMKDFTNGKIDILMATTVIEVGINVPNATVITITGAESFGFSTLHQLRGRVGRGNFESYCILQTTEPNEKLQFLCTTTDGFEISQKDLELRGPGSLFGERQSGDNYYISLMLANQELFNRIKPLAKSLCRSNTGKDIVRRYEEIFKAEEER